MTDVGKSLQYIATNRIETIQTLQKFLLCDVLLFWSDNEELNSLQQQQWSSLLQKLQEEYALCLQTTCFLSVPDNSGAEKRFEELLQNMTDEELTVCMLSAEKLKSVLLGFLLAKKQIKAEQAFAAAYLEELYQNKYWGTDEEADKSRQQIKEELLQIEEYFDGKMS